ncbi:MAG: hypothetical protein AAGJ46_08475 [Planctomycetota bacterium]
MIAIVLASALFGATQPAAGAFSTIINVPPNPAPVFVGSDTQLNVAGGSVGDDLVVGGFDGLSTNVEMNVTGGDVGDNLVANAGAQVNIRGGSIGAFGDAFFGSRVELAGGTLGPFFDANAGSYFQSLGGTIGRGFDAMAGSQVVVAGGVVEGDFNARAGSSVTIVGTDFSLDGTPVPGLEPGTPVVLETRDAALAGTLADGSSFEFHLNSTDAGAGDYFDPLAILSISLLSPADYDRSGGVGVEDYLVWRRQFGHAGQLTADGNGDGVVDAADYSIWRDRLVVAPAATVPEPFTSSLLLVFLGVAYPRSLSTRGPLLHNQAPMRTEVV